MYFTTNRRWSYAVVWCFWFLVLLTVTWTGGPAWVTAPAVAGTAPGDTLALLAVSPTAPGTPWPWQPQGRWRKWALAHYHAAQWAYRRAVWAARGARLLLGGALTLATVVDWLTRAQLRRQLGALPVLYRLLEILDVRRIINRHCASATQVDHGAVVVVLVLNRLMAPRPLYKIADWLAQTVLVTVLDIPAAKFNDDRLGRTLDAIAAHQRDIWVDIVSQALRRFQIDLRFLFYDLTALVAQGAYTDSQLVDYGFAHNTPSNKQKVKLGATASADGAIPADYALHPGRTADLATVQDNMARLCRLLERQGQALSEVLLIGDRANLNDELALAYTDQRLKYLAGLQPRKKAHCELLVAVPERQFYAHPLTAPVGRTPGDFGIATVITFEHHGRTLAQRCLVVLSGPMRRALRQGRAQQFQALRAELAAVRAKIGQKRYRSVKDVQARAATCLRRSPVGRLMSATAYQTATGAVELRWAVDRRALFTAMQHDGRYLLVTNDWHLAPQRMLQLYRSKDALEKRFEVAKQDLRIRPLYVHSDARIRALLLVNMLALLAYSLLERQAQHAGLHITTRRMAEHLEGLTVIETHCHDGSVLRRLTPLSIEQDALLTILAALLGQISLIDLMPTLPAPPESAAVLLLLPPEVVMA
jgi:transposase